MDNDIGSTSNEIESSSISVTFVQNLLLHLGFKIHHLGTSYLCQALTMFTNKDSLFKINLSSQVYPLVAKNNDTTPSRVQKAITAAIKSANWDDKLCQRINTLLEGYSAKQHYPPTPKECVGLLLTGIYCMLQGKTEQQILGEIKQKQQAQ